MHFYILYIFSVFLVTGYHNQYSESIANEDSKIQFINIDNSDKKDHTPINEIPKEEKEEDIKEKEKEEKDTSALFLNDNSFKKIQSKYSAYRLKGFLYNLIDIQCIKSHLYILYNSMKLYLFHI